MRRFGRALRFMTGLLGIVLVTGAAPAVAASDGSWELVETRGRGPSERSAPSVGTLDGAVYLFGGVHDDFRTAVYTFYDDLYRFDPRTSSWTAAGPPASAPHRRPAARAFAGAAGHSERNQLYVFGGTRYSADFSRFATFGDLWVYDVSTDRWDEVDPDTPGPAARSGPAVWIHRDQLYVFGGVTESFAMLNDLWVYDIRSNRWTELVADGAAGAPSGRHVAMTGQQAVANRLVVYGGEGFDPMSGFTIPNDTWAFDLAQGTWTEATPAVGNIAPERNYGAAAVVGANLYLHGGDVPGGSGGCGAPFPQNTTDEIWRFNVGSQTWTPLSPDGPVPHLKRHAAAVVAETMYVFAGYDFVCAAGRGPGQVWSTEVYAYEPG